MTGPNAREPVRGNDTVSGTQLCKLEKARYNDMTVGKKSHDAKTQTFYPPNQCCKVREAIVVITGRLLLVCPKKKMMMTAIAFHRSMIIQ